MEIWMHYLGKGLYTRKSFEDETRKYGIQRSIAFRILSSFKFGMPVLLAYYNVKEKLSECIGYLTIRGLTHNLPRDLLNILKEKLDIVQEEQRNESIHRRCGKYIIGSSYTVKDSIKEITEKIRELCESEHCNPEKFKYFLNGTFTSFGTPLLINEQKFFRGFKRLEFTKKQETQFFENLQSRISGPNVLTWIYDYDKRRYLRKKDLIAIEKPEINYGRCSKVGCKGHVVYIEELGFLCDICTRKYKRTSIQRRGVQI